MSESIDLVVYVAFVVAIWGRLPAWSSRLALRVIAERNPAWIADHPDIERWCTSSRWFHWSCLGWGALSLLTLLAFHVGVWPPPLGFALDTARW
jgi:hypothetical protein